MSDYIDPKYANLRNLLLLANGEITPEIKEEVERITRGETGDNFNKVLSSINSSITTEDILSRISRVPLPKVFLDSVSSTFKTALAPTKLSFMEEVQNYVKVISQNNAQAIRTIPRVVKKSNLKKLENGKFVKAFPNADENENVLNPEFKNLLFNGYKPKDIQEYQEELKIEHPGMFTNPPQAPQNSDIFTDFRIGQRRPEIGTPDSDFLKNYVGGDQPSERVEEISYTFSRPAGLMIDSYKLKDDEVAIKHDNTKLIIDISGTMRIDTTNNQLINSSFFRDLPSWKISYIETKDKYFLNIKNNLKYFPITRITPETSSYRFSGKIPETSLSQQALNLIGELSDQCDVQLGDDLFSSLFTLDGVVETTGQIQRNKNLFLDEKSDLKQYLKNNFKEIFDSVVRQSFGNLNNNRLLQKFSLNPEFDSNVNLIILNLINFIPNPSQELIDCNKNPHPLNLDEVSTLIKQKFSDIGLDIVPKNDDTEEKKDPTTEALSVAVAYMIVRLFIFEYVLKNLIVFDELGYSSSISNGPIIKDYVSILAKKELDQYGIYKSVEKIINENYDFFVTNDIIRPEDIVEDDDDYNSVVDNSLFIKPSKKFKIFTTAILRKVIGFIKNLIGVSEDSSKGDLLISGKIYDVVSINNLDKTVEKKHNGLDIQRLEDLKEFKQFLLFEKYLDIPRMPSDPYINNYYGIQQAQDDSGSRNITSFKEYANYLHKLINFGDNFGTNNLKSGQLKNHIVQNNGKIKNASILRQLFNQTIPSKLGTRLNYVKRENIYGNFINRLTAISTISDSVLTEELRNIQFNIENDNQQTDPNGNKIYDKEKSYTSGEIQQILIDLNNRRLKAISERNIRFELSTANSEINREDEGKLDTKPNGDDFGPFIPVKNVSQLPPDAILLSRGGSTYGIPSLPGNFGKIYQQFRGDTYRSVSEGPGTGRYERLQKATLVVDPDKGINPSFEWVLSLENEIEYWKERLEQADTEETRVDFISQTKNITGVSVEDYSSFYQAEETKFYIKQNKQKFVNIIKNEILKNRQYCFFDDNNDGIYQFNSLPISKYEIEFNVIEIFENDPDISVLSPSDIFIRLNNYYQSKKQQILSNLKTTPYYQLIVNKAIGVDRINNLMSIYSTSALSNVGMENLFIRTKESLHSLLKTVENLDNYEYKSSAKINGYDSLYVRDLQKIGDPNADPNILKFLIQTPILILKGLLNVTDPNMSLAFLIQDIAASGLLFPKLDEQGRVVGYPGDRLIIPSSLLSIAQLPINLFGIPPAGIGIGPPISLPYGPIFWALEPLLWDWPFYKNILNQQKEAADLGRRYNGLNLSTNFTCSRNQDDN